MSRIFWDTNLFIYLLEDKGQFTEQVVSLRERMIERQDQLLTSALTLGEILVKPLEAGDRELMRHYGAPSRPAPPCCPSIRRHRRRSPSFVKTVRYIQRTPSS